MSLALYYAPTTCALIPYVTLTEAGAAFETRPVNLRARDNFSAEYLKLNPLHKVPVLIIDGRALTENVAIQLWIARAFPQAQLLPADPMEEIRALSLLAWFASGVHPHLSRINAPSKFCAAPGSEASTREIAVRSVLDAFAVADGKLEGRAFFFEHFTAADAYFYWCWRRAAAFGVPLAAFPHAAAHFQRVGERASVRAVLAFEAQTLARFAQAA